MSINLEQQTTYKVQPGVSLSTKDTDTGTDTDQGGQPASDFHLLARQLPRTTTRLSRETLENGEGLRARFAEPPLRSMDNADKKHLLLEADSTTQKSTCTYEGDFEKLTMEDATQDDEVECILIYDEENKAFVIERLTSAVVVKSSGPNNTGSSGAGIGMLALPTKKHDPSRERNKGTAREDAQAGGDEFSEDELAKELEGMLDDVSDTGEPGSANPSKSGRWASSGSKQSEKWDNLEDQLNIELEETLGEALNEDAGSDEDEFEEVDGTQFVQNKSNANSMAAEIESLADTPSDEDEDMVFEEVDPSAGLSAGTIGSVRPDHRRGSGSILEDDFEDFEEIGSPRTAQSNTADEHLFEEPVSSISSAGEFKSPREREVDGSVVSADQEIEMGDEFDDLEYDLARNLEDI
ncbi:hypothetical protein GGI07_002064 [Coemansia sp. Benny D115]|nr:hypothetical protein GGI07_002064 [Coemansia sp. Benny D115]